mgnify:CR=1 FL=1
MNNVIISGRCTKEIELKYLPNTGIPVATFTLAVDKDLAKDKKAEQEAKGMPTADFINIVAWNKTGEYVANYLKKGKRAIVNGRIQTRTYKVDDGSNRYITEVVANNIEIIDWDNSNNTDDYMQGFKEVDSDNIPF